MKIISLIPARSGSKGIKDKNIKKLNGKPLMQYAIEASLGSSLIEDTYVSTDSDLYESISKSLGAKTIMRPLDISLDHSTTEEAICHFLNSVKCDIVVLIQATSPLIKTLYLDEAIASLKENKYDSVVSVYKDHGFWWKGNKPQYNPKDRPMRQSQNDLFKESGMFYIFHSKSFLESNCRIHGNVGIYETPKKDCIVEIDDEEDFKLIEKIIKFKY